MRDPKREAYLRENGYDFIYQEEVPLKMIDFRRPTNNKARLGRQIEQWRVDQYERSWRKGADFPAPVVYDIGPDRLFEPVDGYHRLASAYRAEKEKIDAYIVAEPETQFARDALFYVLNTQEGQTTSVDDRCLQAWQLHQDYPEIPLRIIAEKVEISENAFRAHREYAAVRERVFKLGLSRSDVWAKNHSKTTIVYLGRITNEVVFREAFGALERTKQRGQNVLDWLQGLYHAPSEASAISMIKDFVTKYVSRARLQQKGQAPKSTRRTTLDGLATLCDNITKKYLRPIGLGLASIPELDQADQSIASAEAILRARRDEIRARRTKLEEQQEWTWLSTGARPSENDSQT